MSNPLCRIAEIAESQIGTQEDAAHQNKGPAIKKYQDATNFGGQGFPWCAAFVDYCIEQALSEHPELFGISLANRPQTAAAFGLEDWAESKAGLGCHIWTPRDIHTEFAPGRGDIVVYEFSHCGIVTAPLVNGEFGAVEGNTNDDGGRDGYTVARKTRSLSKVRCFIALPLRAKVV